MSFHQLFKSPISGFTYGEPTRKELAEATFQLDAEYRGCGVNIDEQNIDAKVRAFLSSNRLKLYALYINLAKNVIDVENPHYIRPPVRYFRDLKGDAVSDKVQDRIDEIYEQLDFNTFMLQASRQAAYEGTLLAMPIIDELDGRFYFHKLTPADELVEVTPDIMIPSRARVVRYVTGFNTKKQTEHIWDYFVHKMIRQGKGKQITITQKHKYFEVEKKAGGQPWAVLRLLTDHSRFWGPYDGALLSICMTRSLLLADVVHRTQTSLYEILILAGFTPEEALAAARTRATSGMMVFELDKDDQEKPIPGSKSIEYASPDGIAPEKILETIQELYKFFLNARGHSGKNFDSSRTNSTAEAQRIANLALQDLQESRKPYLLKFEQDLFKRIIWANNANPGQKIPIETTVAVDWQPDEQFFNDGTDKANWYDFAIKQNVLTGPDILRQENPELSAEEAEVQFQENKKFNDENVETIAPLVMNAEADQNQEGN